MNKILTESEANNILKLNSRFHFLMAILYMESKTRYGSEIGDVNINYNYLFKHYDNKPNKETINRLLLELQNKKLIKELNITNENFTYKLVKTYDESGRYIDDYDLFYKLGEDLRPIVFIGLGSRQFLIKSTYSIKYLTDLLDMLNNINRISIKK